MTATLLAVDIFNDPWLDIIIPLVFGGLIIGVAVFLYRLEIVNARKLASVRDEQELLHLQRRVRRRKQIAVMIGIIGALLTLVNSQLPWRRVPWLPPIYLFVLMALVAWILLLAMADFLSTRLYAQKNLRDVRKKQLEMEQALLKMKKADRSGESPERN